MRKVKESTSSNLDVRVSSAVPLTEDEQAALRQKLEVRFSDGLSLRF